VIDTNPNDIEPSQAAPRGPPRAPLSAAALAEPAQGPDPRGDGVHLSEVFLLRVEVGPNVVAQEREEGGYRKGLVAVADDLEIDGMPVEAQRQQRGYGVDGDHAEDANGVLLLVGDRVVVGVHEDEVEAHKHSYQGRCSRDNEGQIVKGQGTRYRDLSRREDWQRK
jgi:hypothetical protein